MTLPSNRMSYTDIYEKFQLALEDPRGIRIPFDTKGEAIFYQMRMHQARKVDRAENAKMFPAGHQMHNQCAYDTLQVRIREADDGTFFIYVEPKDKHVGEVEMLSDIENEEAAE